MGGVGEVCAGLITVGVTMSVHLGKTIYMCTLADSRAYGLNPSYVCWQASCLH